SSECSLALGMENGQIPNSRITSEIEGPYDANKASDGRLNNNVGFWNKGQSTWMQVYLGLTTTLAGLVIQGKDSNWVTSYYVQKQSFGGLQYLTHDSNDSMKLFLGNTDGTTPVTNIFDSPIETILVRVEPHKWNGECQLRLELLGCSLYKACMIPSGIESVMGPPDRHEIIDPHDSTTYGRLNSGYFWTPQIPLATALMQVTFTDPMFISGVILQCRPVANLGSGVNCVTSVLIKLGNDTTSMEYINDNTGMPKKVRALR
ncbi:lactadherin-like, partial [Amphiura filiformis]|uniref:lactadherin-like n=1 Tax=Amphiura filiformis TaxID=82378 RepID=UPI003B2166FD